MTKPFIAFLTFALIVLVGCSKEAIDLEILVSVEEPANTIAEAMIPVLEPRGFSATIVEVESPDEILQTVAQGDADLAVIEEPLGMNIGLTTVLPLYPIVLHVMHRSDVNPISFADLLRDKHVYAGPVTGAARSLLAELTRDFGLSADEYTLHDYPWTADPYPDVYFIFGGLLDKDSRAGLSDYRFFSFGSASALGSGTIAEGIALSYANIRTFILPEAIYGDLNDKPILTLATRSVLVASPELDGQVVYDLAEQLVEHSQILAQHYPLVNQELNMMFEPASLTQPLHPGARRFVDRDKPGFLERYVELIALGITLLAALGSGLVALIRYGRQRKKDRVDVYYRKILDLRQRIRSDMNRDALLSISTEVKDVQEEVFALLIDERVSADETLTIFLDLSNQVLKELEPKLSI